MSQSPTVVLGLLNTGTRRSIWLAMACGCLAIMGCGRVPERVVVTGSVNYRGQAVTHGSISFFPSPGTEGTSVIVPIANGRYTVESLGGLAVGNYEVAILGTAAPASPSARTASGERPPPRNEKQYIPSKYNDKTELKTNIKTSPNPFILDFALAD